jgi:hypothetical protein
VETCRFVETYLKVTWWSQAESNRRPLECHSKDDQFLEFPALSAAVRKLLVMGIF